MSKENSDGSNLLEEIRKQFLNFSSLYAKSVNSGANIAGKQIIQAVEKLEKPTDITAGKLITAVKSGSLHAGDQMIGSLIDYVKQMKKN